MGHLGVWMTHVWPLGPDALQSGGGGALGHEWHQRGRAQWAVRKGCVMWVLVGPYKDLTLTPGESEGATAHFKHSLAASG